MKKAILILTILTSAFAGRAQNLVPNGDFEQYSSCPTSQAQIDTALFWFGSTAAGTPDYYHVCCPTTMVSVPYHASGGGYQYPLSGNAYTGIFIYRSLFVNIREYIETQLTSTLTSGVCYHFQMYVNLSNNCNYTSDDIGVYFSDTAITEYTAAVDSLLLPFTPQIQNTTGNFIDTLNWTLISGNYIAQGGENYLMIGNFNHDTATTAIVVNNNISAYEYAYFYIENVSLTPCTGLQTHTNTQTLTLSPNPAKDILNITLNNTNYLNQPITITVTDILGKQIFTSTTTSNYKLQTSNFPQGIYFVKVITGKETLVQKFIKEY